MLLEGVPAPTIEQASSQAGYPAPVLQLSDELNMKLMHKIRNAAREAAAEVIERLGRAPRREGDRPDGRRVRPSRAPRGPGLLRVRGRQAHAAVAGPARAFPVVGDPSAISLKDLEERMMFIESIETVKCLDEGVIESVADANIGSIMGIGFPGWTGGVLQYINGYDGGLPGLSPARASWPPLRRALRAAGVAGGEGRARRDLLRR